MPDFQIGPMRVLPCTPGYLVTRDNDSVGYYSRHEGPARRLAIALSYVSDADWIDAQRQLGALYEQQAEDLGAAA